MKTLVVGLLAAVGIVATPGAQVIWSQLHPATSPPARLNTAMADSAADSLLLFGGVNRLGVAFGDTWIWDGGAGDWVPVATVQSPAARELHAMAYQAARGEVVLFGGKRSNGVGQPPTIHGDTWVWNGVSWSALPAGPAPSPRYGHAIAYDASREVVVLFGGIDASTQFLGDTWEFSGASWTQVPQPGPVAGPPARGSHGMAYVGELPPRVVLFGGYDGSGELGDTWEWDGLTWMQRAPLTAPAARYGHAMVHDASRDRAILFGGVRSAGPGIAALGDTWEWDGSAWSQSNYPVHPGARFGHGMAFDRYRLAGSIESKILLFGGNGSGIIDPLGDTWLGEVWRPATLTMFGTGCAGSMAALMLIDSDTSRPWIGETLQLLITPMPSTTAVGILGASNTMWGATPLPLNLGGPPLYLHPTCFLRVSMDVLTPVFGAPVAPWSLPIPDNPVLVGLTAYVQALALDGGAMGGMVLSNGATLVIGMRD